MSEKAKFWMLLSLLVASLILLLVLNTNYNHVLLR
jgi:hypothetical protein